MIRPAYHTGDFRSETVLSWVMTILAAKTWNLVECNVLKVKTPRREWPQKGTKTHENADLCWSLWGAAWLIAGLHFVFYVIDQFGVLGYATSRDRRGLFLLGYLSINVVPAFLSIPAISLAFRKAAGKPSSGCKYIVATGVLAIIDITISVVLLELLFQYDFPLL